MLKISATFVTIVKLVLINNTTAFNWNTFNRDQARSRYQMVHYLTSSHSHIRINLLAFTTYCELCQSAALFSVNRSISRAFTHQLGSALNAYKPIHSEGIHDDD